MSLILDALKKSQRERHKGKTPRLTSVHGKLSVSRPKSSFRPVLFLFSLISLAIGAGACYVYLASKDAIKIADMPPTKQLETASVTIAEAPPEMSTDEFATSPSGPPVNPGSSTSIPEVPAISGAETQPLLKEEPEGSLPSYENLPTEIRIRVPVFHFSGHTYSNDPAQRMIIVNSSIKREGETIGVNARLIEITWDGVIVEFEGTRFFKQTE
jgi:general secretion pathway protein B